MANSKIAEYEKTDDIYKRIQLGILYIKTGQKRKGINTLDEICASEPDLMITPAIKQYIKESLKENI